MDRQKLLSECVRELTPADETQWQQSLEKLRSSIGGDNGLAQWFEQNYGRLTFQDLRIADRPAAKNGMAGITLCLNTADFGVTNVSDAAQLCEKILGYKAEGINAHLIPNQEPKPSSIARRILGNLRAAIFA